MDIDELWTREVERDLERDRERLAKHCKHVWFTEWSETLLPRGPCNSEQLQPPALSKPTALIRRGRHNYKTCGTARGGTEGRGRQSSQSSGSPRAAVSVKEGSGSLLVGISCRAACCFICFGTEAGVDCR